MAVKLHHRQFSDQGFPVVILHGLFGQLGNWMLHARELASEWRVYALDVRNHGRSPWDPLMTYAAMAEDLALWMDQQGIESAHLMGHSMGGKAAMQFALSMPERVARLAVVDIAPVTYGHGHEQVIAGLRALDLANISSRQQADTQLVQYIEDKAVRDFLLTNLARDDNGAFVWRMNLEVLAGEYDHIAAAPEATGRFQGPTLFIKGGNSDYLLPSHQEAIVKRFPNASLKVIEGAGHWVHSEKPQAFLKIVGDFLRG